MLFSTVQLSIRCLKRPNILRVQNIESMIKKQYASGWIHRRPVAVMNEEIVLDSAEAAPQPRKYIDVSPEYRPLKPRKRHQPPNKKTPKIESDETYKEDGTPNIIKYSEKDRKLATLIMSLKSRKLREKNDLILIEGRRLIGDAIDAGLKLDILLFSRITDIEKMSLPKKGVKIYKVPYVTLQLWSNLTTTQGLIGIFKMPKSFEKKLTENTLPLTIICDNVREPGNLGSILRAAAGVGCERVILTKGCVDVWEAKVLRSSAGAHFRVSISKSVDWEEIKSMINPYANVYIADNDISMRSNEESSESSMTEIRTDSETNLNDENVKESAEFSTAAVEVEKDSKKSDAVKVEENSETSDTTEFEEDSEKIDAVEVEEDSKKFDAVPKYIIEELKSRIPAIPYYAANYTSSEIVLIVGGETEGLSYESVELVKKHGGVRVHVPLNNDVESLNTGMALGIVAFEVKRQFAIRKDSINK